MTMVALVQGSQALSVLVLGSQSNHQPTPIKTSAENHQILGGSTCSLLSLYKIRMRRAIQLVTMLVSVPYPVWFSTYKRRRLSLFLFGSACSPFLRCLSMMALCPSGNIKFLLCLFLFQRGITKRARTLARAADVFLRFPEFRAGPPIVLNCWH